MKNLIKLFFNWLWDFLKNYQLTNIQPKVLTQETTPVDAEVTVDKPQEFVTINKPVDKVDTETEKKPEIVKKDKPKTIVPQFVLERKVFNETETIGSLYKEGEFFCYTLEDKDRKLEEGGKKIYGETAIPRGTYEIRITWSNRFKKPLPILLNVPQFEGIRIHTGNTAASSSGCLIFGKTKTKNSVLKSSDAINEFITVLTYMLKKEKVYIQIK